VTRRDIAIPSSTALPAGLPANSRFTTSNPSVGGLASVLPEFPNATRCAKIGIIRVIRGSKMTLEFSSQFFFRAYSRLPRWRVAAATEEGLFVRRQPGLYIRVEKSLRKMY
jgi:hypothetical protein